MPRKLGPRHAKSRLALATVNRLASAANDIRRLAWHDHQTQAGEALVSTFTQAGSAFAIDRQVARDLSTLWLFTRHLAQNLYVEPAKVTEAQRALNRLYRIPGLNFSQREYVAAHEALRNVDDTAETARALSGILARIARLRCNWNSNGAYQARVDRKGTVWSEGALWNPPLKDRRRRELCINEARVLATAQPSSGVITGRPTVTVVPGEGKPAPTAEEFVEETFPLLGLRRRSGLGALGVGSIFAWRVGGRR